MFPTPRYTLDYIILPEKMDTQPGDFIEGCLRDREEYMAPMIELGVQGIELWHPCNKPETYEEIAGLIEKHNLYTGGGTDHHGHMEGRPDFDPNKKENAVRSIPYAMFGVTEEKFRQLKERALG